MVSNFILLNILHCGAFLTWDILRLHGITKFNLLVYHLLQTGPVMPVSTTSQPLAEKPTTIHTRKIPGNKKRYTSI